MSKHRTPSPKKIEAIAALFGQGHYREAEPLARNLTIQFPQHGFGWKALGALLKAQGRTVEALPIAKKAAALAPDDPQTHFNLAITFKELGRLNDAEKSYRQALSINPCYAEAHNNLGVMLEKLNRLNEAEYCFRQALQFSSDYAEAHFNLGNVLMELGHLDEAEKNFRLALQVKPDYVDANNNFGSLLRDTGRLEEAATCYRRALQIMPDSALILCNLANVLMDLGHLDESRTLYQRTFELEPGYDVGRSAYLFSLSYRTLVPPAAYLAEARKWQQFVIPQNVAGTARSRQFNVPPRDGRRLRIGYVSGDFRQHAISYFVELLFRHHDRNRVELFAYTSSSIRDTVTERLETLADHWQSITKLSNDQASLQIENDKIDVLVDLSGHTQYNRLGVFARRAAPVQLHYLGFQASTGLAEMDYWLGDSVLIPATEDAYYSETIWRLPRVWVCYGGNENAPASHWQPAVDGTLRMGSFNHLNKLNEATLALWAKVLHALPEAKLVIKTRALAEASNKIRMETTMLSHGISAERLELLGDTPDWSSHMALYDRLDIALDPVAGHGGCTTTCDALWMGAPVITLAGQWMGQRMTASILHSLGHPEWIAESEEDYIAKVIALARNVELRRSLRHQQRELMRNSPLCDAAGLTCALEEAFEAMFDERPRE